MFFRKKNKYTDVEGYNRISRLIEDRQREISRDMTEDEDFDEDSVLLNHDRPPRERTTASFGDERETVSAVRPLGPPTSEPPPPAPQASDAGALEWHSPFSINQTEPVVPPPSVSTPPPLNFSERELPAPPPMRVQDFGNTPMTGSLVAAEAVWEGSLTTNGQLRVEGTLHGDIQTPSSIFVAANAHMDGSIRAGSLVIAGEVEGKVHCSERLEVLPGGSARGEIETAALIVHEGAFIDSRFQMRKPA